MGGMVWLPLLRRGTIFAPGLAGGYTIIMNILLYGAGAVGLGLASCLLKSGHRVDLVTRSDTADAFQTAI